MQGESYWREKIAVYKESGLTQTEFCKREGYKIDTFKYWLKKSRGKRVESKNEGSLFVKLETGLPSISGLEIAYPNGVIVRLGSYNSLSDLRTFILLYDV